MRSRTTARLTCVTWGILLALDAEGCSAIVACLFGGQVHLRFSLLIQVQLANLG